MRERGRKGRVLMDAAEAMNHIARAVEEAMGDPVNSQEGAPPRGPWLPLSVRYGAAEAAVKVVIAWKEKGLLYGGDGSGLDAAKAAHESRAGSETNGGER